MTTGRTFLSAFTPSLMSQEALEAIFVQTRRKVLLDRLINDLQFSATTANKKHTLLVGPRGMGKTHLITMLYHRLRSNPENAELDSLIRISWLNEEERGIPTFGHFVRRILLKLAEEYKDESLTKQTDDLLDSPSELEARATELLTEWLGDKTLLLIVENFDDILRRMGEQGQRGLRAYLQNKNNTFLLAATPSLTLPLTSYEAPFYAFFNLETLHELDEADALALLKNIADWRKDEELAAFLNMETALNRIRVIEALAGGHPRIWILFAGVLTKQTLDETVPLFLEMLDDLTPYYQSRLDALSPQQAQVMECLIEKGRSVPVWEIARNCLMEPNSVSVQLRLLGEMGYVRGDKIGRVAYYEIREPLMRLCLEVKKSRGKPLQILVDFLRRWYDRNELESRLALCLPDNYYDKIHFQAALELSKNVISDSTADQQSVLAIRLSNEGKLQEAIALATEMSNRRGGYQDYYILGFCQDGDRMFFQAIQSYDQALAINPEFQDAWLNRGNSLQNINQYDEAIDSYNKIIQLNRNNPDKNNCSALVNMGVALAASGRVNDALNCLHQAHDLEPKDAMILSNIGGMLSGLARYEESIEYFDRSIALKQKNFEALCNKAASLTELNRLAEALECLNTASQIEPDNTTLLMVKTNLLLRLGRFDEALPLCKRAVELNDGDTNLLIRLGNLHLLLKQFPEALATFELASEIDNENSEIWYWIGVSLESLQRYESALEAFQKTLSIQPKSLFALISLAGLLHTMERYDEALRAIDEAEEINSDQEEIWVIKGNILGKMDRLDDALACFDKAVILSPNNPMIWNDRGNVLCDLKRYKDSLDSLEKGCVIDPLFPILYQSKSEIFFMMGEWSHGLENLRVCIKLESDNNKSHLKKTSNWKEHSTRVWRGLLRFASDANLWQDRIGILLKLYKEHGVLSEVGNGLMQMMKDLLEPAVSEFTADAWNDAFQVAGKQYEEMEIPLRLLNAAVQWKKTRDRVTLLSLRSEERAVLIEALSLTPEEVKGK